MTKRGDTLRGRARVAHELGVSERTASRWRKKGVIEIKQLGGRTSAWRVDSRAVEGSDDKPAKPRGRR